MKRAENPTPKIPARILGLGLDNTDGEKRLTRGKNFTLFGGSEETHAVMQETAIKINEKLDQKGKRLEDVSQKEFRDILDDVANNIGYKKRNKNDPE
ncbi:MAG: hypothetical protein Q4C95_02060 [Planctomycetia bacterium]|nr:hypothetical protein [Planctomycetia bacterium]